MDSSPPPAPPPSTGSGLAFQLAVVRKGQKPLLYRLEAEPIVLGRSEEAGLQLADPQVAGRHVRLTPAGSGWQVTDLGSEHGTYLAGEKLAPEVGTAWSPDDTLRVGPFFLRWRPLPAAGTVDGSPAEASAAGEDRSELIGIAVSPAQVLLDAGEEATIEIELENRGSRVDHFTVDLSGLPREWVSTSHEFLRLAPGGRASLPITIHLPTNLDTNPGDHPYQLTVTSSAQETAPVSIEGVVTIPTVVAYSATLEPERWRHGDTGKVVVRNQGNTPLRLIVSGDDPEGAVIFGERQPLLVAPGAEEAASLTAEAAERPWLIREETLPFSVSLRSQGGDKRELAGELVVPPRIRLGCLLLVVLPVVVVAVVLAGISAGLIAAGAPSLDDQVRLEGSLQQHIRSQWQTGLEISDLAGAEDVWLLLMTEPEEEVRQSWRAPDALSESYLEQQAEAGWTLTELAHANGRWLLVMDQVPDSPAQRWQLAAEFPAEFIEAQAAEGYALTELAYGDGLWAVIVTRGADGDQRWQLAPTFPAAYVEEQWAQGYAVRNVAYGDSTWAVVMGEAAAGTRQAWQTGATFPAGFVEQRWQLGFDVSEVARGHGVWAVVMTQVPGADRRQTWQAADTLR